MMHDEIKVLVVEDNLGHAKLIEYQVLQIAPNAYITHVTNFSDFKHIVNELTPHIILCDYNLTRFSGIDVLKYTQMHMANTIFIFVTELIQDEELAANTILNGASGYILKKHMNILYQKLLPYFEQAVYKKKLLKYSPEYTGAFKEIYDFVESANKDNQQHIQSCLEMKKALERLKSKE